MENVMSNHGFAQGGFVSTSIVVNPAHNEHIQMLNTALLSTPLIHAYLPFYRVLKGDS